MSGITPELDVSDIGRSLTFYVEVLGFKVKFERPEEKFACLEINGADLMLEEVGGPGRRFRTAPLEYPYGRGVNFQIEVTDVDEVYGQVWRTNAVIVIPMEERWYRKGDREAGNRQFVVADPDGFLLRLFTSVGERPVQRSEKG